MGEVIGLGIIFGLWLLFRKRKPRPEPSLLWFDIEGIVHGEKASFSLGEPQGVKIRGNELEVSFPEAFCLVALGELRTLETTFGKLRVVTKIDSTIPHRAGDTVSVIGRYILHRELI